jgi:hypothetical protein
MPKSLSLHLVFKKISDAKIIGQMAQISDHNIPLEL